MIIYDNKEFKKIEKGKGFYYICKDTSEILSIMKPNAPKILKQVVNGNGYYMVGFFSKPNRINVNVHRVFMETFTVNLQQLPHINHIDGNKLNNSLENLEWCSAKYNTQHAHNTGLATNSHCSIPVYKYSLNGKYIGMYKSLHEAAYCNKTSTASIHHVITGKQKTAAGHIWSKNKHQQVKSFTHKIVNYYTVNEKIVKKMKELCLVLNMTRASIHRRFKKFGNNFTINNNTVTRIFYT